MTLNPFADDVAKTADIETAAPGDTVTYEITTRSLRDHREPNVTDNPGAQPVTVGVDVDVTIEDVVALLLLGAGAGAVRMRRAADSAAGAAGAPLDASS